MERQELISEVQPKSYEAVRLSRVKYRGNHYDFIDIRLYRRGYDEDGEEVFYPTKQGVQIKEELFRRLVEEHFLNLVEQQMKEG